MVAAERKQTVMKTEKTKKKQSLGTRIKKEWRRHHILYLMSIPLILYYALFQYGPMYGVIMAFQDYNIRDGIWGSEFVGLENFTKFFQSSQCWRLIRNTLSISIQSIIFSFPAPLILALLLNEIKSNKFKRVVQTVTYLPHFISVVVVCGMLHQFLARDGFITSMLSAIGLVENKNLLGIKELFQPIFIFSGIWQEVGWGSIIYLAALTGIDEQLYEAAMIDGANRWKRILHVTLPGIAPTIIMMLILRMGSVMSVGYEKIILLYNPQTYETADVLSTYIYRYGLGGSFDYGYTTAIGVFSPVINLILIVAANQISRKVSETSLW